MSIDNFIAQFNYWASQGEYNEFTLYLCRLFLKIDRVCVKKFDDTFLGLDRPFKAYQMHDFQWDLEKNELTVGTIDNRYLITSSEKRAKDFEEYGYHFRTELQDFNVDLRENFKKYFHLSSTGEHLYRTSIDEQEFQRHINNALNWLWIANMEIEKEQIEKQYNKLNSHVQFIKNLFNQ